MGHRQHIWAMGGSHMVNKSLMNAKKTLSQHSCYPTCPPSSNWLKVSQIDRCEGEGSVS